MAITRLGGANAITGTIPTSVAPGQGKILQIVTASNDTAMHTTTSTSFATTGTTASITPSSTSSKIYVISSCDIDMASTGTVQYLTIFRGSTNIGLSTTADGGQNGLSRVHDVSAGRYLFRQMLQVLDTPNSSSSVTYTLQQRISQGTARVRNDLIPAQITLMEIA